MFIFLLLIEFLYATPSTREIQMPDGLRKELCQKLTDTDQGCTNNDQLRYGNYFKLDNDKLLLFFYLYSKNAPYPHGYTNIPVMVDSKGKWQVGDTAIDAEIQEISRDPQNGIWVNALWKKKGITPSLYYSENGIQWRLVTLPTNRGVNSNAENVKLCFLDKEIELTFKSLTNTVMKSWKSDYQNAVNQKPNWKLIPQHNMCQYACYKISAYNNAWQFKEQEGGRSNIVFRHQYQPLSLVLSNIVEKKNPAPLQKMALSNAESITASGTYGIQLGLFSQEKSLNNAYNMVKNTGYTPIKKKINSKQKKLFLGTFKSHWAAQNSLNKLKQKYKTNKIIQKAFIAKVP